MWFGKKKKDEKTNEKKSVTKEKRKAEEKKDSKAGSEKIAKEKKAIYRVVFSRKENVWQIKKDGARRVIDSKVTKDEALARVKELSESQDTKFVVHKKDGKFQKKANLK